jgi:hypothetical protein
MADQNELAQLELERERLLSMIAHHNGPFYRTKLGLRAPTWFVAVAATIIVGIGFLIVAGIFADQISAPGVLLLVVGLPLSAYILTRRVTVFGTPVLAGDILANFWGPTGRPAAGEPETRQRLADCEARIVELKERRL